MKTQTTIQTGTEVKPSESAIRPLRDHWLSRGIASEKLDSKAALDRAIARRGIVTEIRKGQYSTFAIVQWNDGIESQTALYLIETSK